MPEALLLTSTLVMGWIFPVATTDLATSPRVTLAILLESMDEPFARCARPTPAPARSTINPTLNQIQNRLLFRAAATEASQRINAAAVVRGIKN